MTHRNRRRRARAFLVPAPVAGVIVLAVTLALVYVWMDHACSALGQQIRDLEQTHAALRNDLVRESNRWTTMKTPANLERALLRHGIIMNLPRPEQVVRVRSAPSASERESVPMPGHWARLERDG